MSGKVIALGTVLLLGAAYAYHKSTSAVSMLVDLDKFQLLQGNVRLKVRNSGSSGFNIKLVFADVKVNGSKLAEVNKVYSPDLYVKPNDISYVDLKIESNFLNLLNLTSLSLGSGANVQITGYAKVDGNQIPFNIVKSITL